MLDKSLRLALCITAIASSAMSDAGCGTGSTVPQIQKSSRPVVDPWFTNGLTDYVVLAGSPSTFLLSPTLSGSPAGAQMATDGFITPTDTAYIAQDIDGAATLPVGTRVTVSGYFYATTRTIADRCNSFSVTGAYAVGIVTKGGTSGSVLTLASGASTAAWSRLSGSITITTPGAYQAVWSATENSRIVRVPLPPPNRACSVAGPIAGQGFATDLSIAVIYPGGA
jgi:hypothetical protein